MTELLLEQLTQGSTKNIIYKNLCLMKSHYQGPLAMLHDVLFDRIAIGLAQINL